ncbi:HAD family hydrolase [Herbidospora sp. RD11066]
MWDFQGALRRALVLALDLFLAEGATIDGEPVTLDWLAKAREAVAARPAFANARMEDIRRVSFEECARQASLPDEFADRVYAEFMHARHAEVRLYPDTLPCLEALAAMGLRLGLITNGNSRPGPLGLDALLSCTVVAAECGYRKPDPRIYHHAAAKLGVAAAECVHVGDHITEDVQASAEAGMRAVWLDRSRTGEGARAWRTVTSLEALPALLE